MMKVRLCKRQRQNSIPPLNLEELKEDKAVQFAAEVTSRFTASEAAQNEVTQKISGKVPRKFCWRWSWPEKRLDPSSRRRKRNGYLMRLTIREKREAKGRQEATSRTEGRGYKESSEWINSSSWKGRMCMELKTANSKGNSRKLFQIVKSMTRKFQPRLQAIHQQLAKI